jgi:hypothetical protein
MVEELGIPCEKSAAESYPNLPKSVHPGVLTGQALIDLLNHAKENGKAHIAQLRHDTAFNAEVRKRGEGQFVGAGTAYSGHGSDRTGFLLRRFLVGYGRGMKDHGRAEPSRDLSNPESLTLRSRLGLTYFWLYFSMRGSRLV